MKLPLLRALWIIGIVAGTASFARADVSLPAVISSHMVLQRDVPLPIWGWASPGEEVAVAIGENKATTKANELGRWMAKLAPLPAGGPLEMTVTGKNTIKLTNILVGEVWIGSGQSNMQWSVTQSNNGPEEISAATYPKIRLFSVPLVPSGTPANDVNATWKECSPETVGGFSAVAYFFGREVHKALDVPVGMINSSWGGTRIEPWIPSVGFMSQPDLKQESESVRLQNKSYQEVMKRNVTLLRPWLEVAEKAIASGQEIPNPPSLPAHPLNSNGQPTGLYNGMIHPLAPFAIRGALWYQGESNNGQGMHYNSLMKGLISGWREVWGQGEFPFLYVQLAPYRYGGKETSLPEIWEAQTATLAVPNTGMAVITDIGAVGDIHPRNKQDVGKRLALWALAKTYGKSDLVYSGPLYDSMSVELDQIQIKFKHAEGGLVSRDGKPLTWFTIAGEDKKFVPAMATISGNTVVVQSPKVSNPVAVRFGWSQLAEPNLANKAGLPTSPFRTDAWNDNAPDFPSVK
jgi:sialate O-acetylesterase